MYFQIKLNVLFVIINLRQESVEIFKNFATDIDNVLSKSLLFLICNIFLKFLVFTNVTKNNWVSLFYKEQLLRQITSFDMEIELILYELFV